jgi:general secretion pathway protein D
MELNAKRISTVIVAVSALVGTTCLTGPFDTECAAQQSVSAGVTANSLSRSQIDELLKQARASIQQGNLDQANALLTRAEGARVHYPVLHFGLTPASVRREFAQAEKRLGPAKRSSAQSQPLNRFAGDNPQSPPVSRQPNGLNDPFAARQMPLPSGPANLSAQSTANQFAPPADANANRPLPILPVSRPLPPTINPGAYDTPTSPGVQIADNLPSMGRQADNPFGQTLPGQSRTNSGRYGAPAASNNDYPVGQAGFVQAAPDGPADAPLPPGMRQTPTSPRSAYNFAPPDRSQPPAAAQASISDAPAAQARPTPKQQVQSQLQAARQALDAGNLDLAEQLAHEARAVGVPESQFLPDEDRPSFLASDIVRARQSARGVQSAVATLPAGAPRYAQQVGQAPAAEAYPIVQAQAVQAEPLSPVNSDERWAMTPETLNLPADPSAAPLAVAAPLPSAARLPQTPTDAMGLVNAGEAALRMHDRRSALELFGQAHLLRDQLEPADQDRLQEHLHMLASEPVDTQIPRAAEALAAQQASGSGAESTPFGARLAQSQASDSPFDQEDLAGDTTDAPPQELQTPPDTSVTEAIPPGQLESADQNEQVLARQISAEVGKRQSEAQRLLEENPERALAILKEAQKLVNDSKLSDEYRRELSGRIDITLAKTEKYIAGNKAEIDFDAQNEAVMDAVERDREVKAKVQEKMAELVEKFNQLQDEQRYAEAEVVARQLIELAPDDPVAQQVWQMAKFIRREQINDDLADRKEQGNWDTWNDVEQSSVSPVGDGHELVFGDAKDWEVITRKRQGSRDRTQRRTERELEIERRLKTPVQLKYQDTPLSQVINNLSELSGVNIHLDPLGLSQEGIHTDTPVTVSLNKEISLKSALNLILEPLHLSYVIKDEVLKITSEQLRDGEIYAEIYNVADLVIPIPNFVPNSNLGLQGLINDAHSAMGYGQSSLNPGTPSVLVGGRQPNQSSPAAGDDIVAQNFNPSPTSGATAGTVPIGAGPGGMGGGAQADFDSLIDLIVSTVSTETWAENGGGEAEIRPFPTNLSLVISQTQAVHEEIADLLEQLRKLQDLQVTIEVRFIRLNDRFFERIGVDFQMNIEDRSIGTADLVPGQPYEPGRQSATVGLQVPVTPTNPFPNYTSDLDIPFRQSSFAASSLVPFGGQVNGAATFGFAILSDLEAFFLIEAAQSDSRTNILNAPKVTLFNGQQAFVGDVTQRPFVIGVIPVVGEFVAAQQPIIVVLNEGTMMTIQAVVSDDRRYIRLTVVPFFTQVGDVDEFTFEGASSSSSSSSSSDDNSGKSKTEDDSKAETRSGVTVQLPSFSFVSVVTTVSVPDGGTVLLGGIKRLQEGRSEFGVPLLSKVPYVDRLFRNVGIGRTTESLMMMVTPRIIIQEEEEERLGIATP